MKASKHIICTVTNDLVYDQRMIRICTSLANAGYAVLLVGRQYSDSPALEPMPFAQKRLSCFFRKGKWFYVEYNLRLFFFLLARKADLLCAIDLDTILPVLYASKIKGTKRLYDAHELFCEMKEVVSRPRIFRIWKKIEQHCVPQFQLGYTVNAAIRDLLRDEYNVHYDVVRNVPVLRANGQASKALPFILYQGAVNEGRSFETLLPAFKWVHLPLHIYGDGNFIEEAKKIVQQHGLQSKVLFKSKKNPEALRQVTGTATLGITLFENKGLNNYYSLANRFFDYIHAAVPQLCVAYPAYAAVNKEFEVAVLIEDLSSENIAKSINTLLADEEKLGRLKLNCEAARLVHNWQEEEKILLRFYKHLFE